MTNVRHYRTKNSVKTRLFLLAVSVVVITPAGNEGAQAQPPRQPARIEGLSRQPTQAASDALLDPSDAVLLLLDHQTGLFQTVKDVPLRDLRANTVALAKIAGQMKIPI